MTWHDNTSFTCPVLEEIRYCNTFPCSQNCIVSGWGNWTACSKSCNGGLSTRSRNVLHAASAGGVCIPLKEHRSCGNQHCPTDCVSVWGNWSDCSARCGGGHKTHVRRIVHAATYGGSSCLAQNETAPCNDQKCDFHNAQVCSNLWCTFHHTMFDTFVIRVRHHKNEANGDHHLCRVEMPYVPHAGVYGNVPDIVSTQNDSLLSNGEAGPIPGGLRKCVCYCWGGQMGGNYNQSSA